MPVSGLVVSLCDEAKLRSETLAQIEQEPRITRGALEANRLAIVLDTMSRQEDKHLWDWLGALPAVTLVQVAFVGFEQQEASLSHPCGPQPGNPVTALQDDVQDGR